MPFRIPLTAAHSSAARKQEERRRREQEDRAARERREKAEKERKEKERKAAAGETSTSTVKAVPSPSVYDHQKLNEELTKEFGQKITSQIKWRAMTPPRDQCMYFQQQQQQQQAQQQAQLLAQQQKKKQAQQNTWDSEFGGGKRKTRKTKKTRKTRKTKKNKKSSSCKNKKYFFW